MTIALISTSDRTGGAALACNSLFKALSREETKVRCLVRDRMGTDELVEVTANDLAGKIRWHFLNERSSFILRAGSRDYWFLFSPAEKGENILHNEILQSADIIHIHWINSGFLSTQMLNRITSLKKPVLFTLHDMWLFTGGCHHPFTCNNFNSGCGNCYMLRRPRPNDISRKGFLKKKAFLEKKNVYFVTVSNWLKNRFLESDLKIDENRIRVIPNVINTELFKPMPARDACSMLGIDADTRYIVFGAQNLRSPLKGLDLLVSAFNHLKNSEKQHSSIETGGSMPVILLFGKYNGNIGRLADSIPYKIKYLGTIRDQALLPAVYSAAHLTVVPSLYETFGQVIAESLSCGTPAVAFRNSGPTEIIQHMKTGYLAEYESAEDFAEGIQWGLKQKDLSSVRMACRQSIEQNYADRLIARQYMDLYEKMIQLEI